MNLKIRDGWLEGPEVRHQRSPNKSGGFAEGLADTLVMHFTAGRSVDSSANWLCDPAASASTHLIIGRKGEIVQLVPFNTIAWHAGKSEWAGRSGLNRYAIGIELDNAGDLKRNGENYVTWYGEVKPPTEVPLVPHPRNI